MGEEGRSEVQSTELSEAARYFESRDVLGTVVTFRRYDTLSRSQFEVLPIPSDPRYTIA